MDPVPGTITARPDGATRPPPAWVTPVARIGALAVVFYVGSWALAGVWWESYDPVSQAISELFAVGAPDAPARLLSVSLVVTGLVLPAFAAALHRGLPGDGLAGPVLAGVSGLCTAAIVAYPCSPGCPGAATSTTDLGHTVLAGVGYFALVVVPLLFARRLWHHDRTFARWSLVLGTIATLGFVLRLLGVGDGSLGGLLQRGFNTVADSWYVLAAVVMTRRAGAGTGT